MDPYIGQTVTLTDLPAYDPEHGDCLISGAWEIEAYDPAEPDVGIWNDCYVLVSPTELDSDGMPRCVTVDPWTLIRQIDFRAHMSMRLQEIEMELYGLIEMVAGFE